MPTVKKVCIKCGELKAIIEFYKHNMMADGHLNKCIECSKKGFKEHRILNYEKLKKAGKEWRKLNAEKISKKNKIKYIANKQAAKEKARKWVLANPEKRKKIIKRSNDKIRGTGKGRLCNRIGCMINRSLKTGSKSRRHWETLLPFTREQFLKHIKKQFKEGMSFDNYGEWHVDHKIPIDAFNFQTPEDHDFKICWSLKNLQPLWAKDNLSKNNKLSKPFQPSLIFGEK